MHIHSLEQPIHSQQNLRPFTSFDVYIVYYPFFTFMLLISHLTTGFTTPLESRSNMAAWPNSIGLSTLCCMTWISFYDQMLNIAYYNDSHGK